MRSDDPDGDDQQADHGGDGDGDLLEAAPALPIAADVVHLPILRLPSIQPLRRASAVKIGRGCDEAMKKNGFLAAGRFVRDA